MADFKFKLGEMVRDRITGVEGIVIANSEWLTGCNTVSVKPQGTKPDGLPYDSIGFDEPMVERVGPGLTLEITPPTDPKQKGGPRPEVRRSR